MNFLKMERFQIPLVTKGSSALSERLKILCERLFAVNFIVFAVAQICSASPFKDAIKKPSVIEARTDEIENFTFQTLSNYVGRILYSQNPAHMRWELEVRSISRDKNGEIQIESNLRRVGHRAFPITLRTLAGEVSEKLHFKEVLGRYVDEYMRKKRGRRNEISAISQESVVVGRHYFGGRNKITKEFYLIVDWPSGEIKLWVVSRSGMGNEKFESGRLELSRTSRSFDILHGGPAEHQARKQQIVNFAEATLASYVDRYLVTSGKEQIRLAFYVQDTVRAPNDGLQINGKIVLGDGVIQNIEFKQLVAEGEFYNTFNGYRTQEHLKERKRNLGVVNQGNMVYVGRIHLGGKDQLLKEFYLIVEWPTAEIKMWVVSKVESGREKIEKVNLRKFLGGCQEFLSIENMETQFLKLDQIME